MNICACIAKKTVEECIALIKKTDADLIEHRMDFMENIVELRKIYRMSRAPIIATNRSLANGGHFKGNEKNRIDKLFYAVDAGCTLIDVEIKTKDVLKQDIIQYARENNCGVIISMHDFRKTPKRRTLYEIMNREREQGADIGKIVTTAFSLEDCHVILDLLMTARKEHFPLVAFAMGDVGVFTRIATLYYGAPFTYASVEEQTGPGQLSLSTLKKVRRVVVP